MKAIILKHDLTVEVKEVGLLPVGYEFLKDTVGGYIEHLAGYNNLLDNNHIAIWCNEEHKLKENWQDEINIVFCNENNDLIEVLVGTVIFLKDGIDGETYGLNDFDTKLVLDMLEDRCYLGNGGKVKEVIFIDYDK